MTAASTRTAVGPNWVALARVAGLLCLAVAATLIYLWQHHRMVTLGYHIEAARKDLAQLDHQRDELLLESANLSSLERVERIARARLGMTAPEPEQLVRVEEPTGGDSSRNRVLLAAGPRLPSSSPHASTTW